MPILNDDFRYKLQQIHGWLDRLGKQLATWETRHTVMVSAATIVMFVNILFLAHYTILSIFLPINLTSCLIYSAISITVGLLFRYIYTVINFIFI